VGSGLSDCGTGLEKGESPYSMGISGDKKGERGRNSPPQGGIVWALAARVVWGEI